MLTPRLCTIANLIEKGQRIADIGTDHAYIPIYLAKNNIITTSVASDINQGPFQIAKNNVRSAKLENVIDVRLGCGLSPILENEVDVAVIAGMGGELISSILLEGKQIADTIETFILQPMAAIDELRRFLYTHNFCIENEIIAKEGNKFYIILTVKHGFSELPDEIYYYIGENLIRNGDIHLKEYIAHLIHTYTVVLEGMQRSKREELNVFKYEYLISELEHFK